MKTEFHKALQDNTFSLVWLYNTVRWGSITVSYSFHHENQTICTCDEEVLLWYVISTANSM
ncbi:hypothetical protein E2C01_029076 [Portunus trituberculatus]|uniref:Uncharacterized protein n=1 Tax=Portunus trituberculatus TaxID=210409 RepID=A0A5B7ERA5_PORTR|nr:hypothetical protein [Portunus trituberculatus]